MHALWTESREAFAEPAVHFPGLFASVATHNTPCTMGNFPRHWSILEGPTYSQLTAKPVYHAPRSVTKPFFYNQEKNADSTSRELH